MSFSSELTKVCLVVVAAMIATLAVVRATDVSVSISTSPESVVKPNKDTKITCTIDNLPATGYERYDLIFKSTKEPLARFSFDKHDPAYPVISMLYVPLLPATEKDFVVQGDLSGYVEQKHSFTITVNPKLTTKQEYWCELAALGTSAKPISSGHVKSAAFAVKAQSSVVYILLAVIATLVCHRL